MRWLKPQIPEDGAHQYRKWFAWYPIECEGHYVWLESCYCVYRYREGDRLVGSCWRYVRSFFDAGQAASYVMDKNQYLPRGRIETPPLLEEIK